MKCLLCGSAFEQSETMERHYHLYHRIDPKNYFFRDLFLTDNGILFISCCRCDDFITTKQHLRQHNF